MRVHTTTCWPGAPRFSSFRPSGTSSAISTASAASGAMFRTLRGWNLSIALEALEVVEGLSAAHAAVVCLAGRGAELAQAFGGTTPAARTGHRTRATQCPHARHRFLRGRDAKGAEPGAPLRAQPRARPGGVELLLEHRVSKAVSGEG